MLEIGAVMFIAVHLACFCVCVVVYLSIAIHLVIELLRCILTFKFNEIPQRLTDKATRLRRYAAAIAYDYVYCCNCNSDAIADWLDFLE